MAIYVSWAKPLSKCCVNLCAHFSLNIWRTDRAGKRTQALVKVTVRVDKAFYILGWRDWASPVATPLASHSYRCSQIKFESASCETDYLLEPRT